MKPAIATFLAAVTFGTGLVVAGITQPAKVLAFLRLDEGWDPSLAFVLGSAFMTYGGLRLLIRRRGRPLLDAKFHEPSATGIDKPLLTGAALFGTGWGLSGYCPGPALISGAADLGSTAPFLTGLASGMGAFQLWSRWSRRNAGEGR